jgi:leucine dehydrogenase
LSCKIIAGAANNQLSDPSVYELIKTKGIVYCPDFAINSGGVISTAAEVRKGGGEIDWIKEKVAGVYATTAQILDEAQRSHRDTEVVALELAKEKIAEAKRRSIK